MNPLRSLLLIGMATLISLAGRSTGAQTRVATPTTFYVAPHGDDQHPGSLDQPFQTVIRARDAIRSAKGAKMTRDFVVELRGGTYPLNASIVFEPEDSGTDGHRIIYRSQPGQTAVLSGGRAVTGWQPDQNGRWKTQTDLADFRQLYVNGIRAVRARGELPAGVEMAGEDGYRTTAVEMADWKNPGDIEFCYWVVWCHTRCKVASIQRTGEHATLAMLQPHFTQARTKEGVQIDLPSYIENALELLDEPGEWYLDRSTKTVYYMPRPNEDMGTVEVIVPAIERLIDVRGTLDRPIANISFVGLSFQHADWLEPSASGLVDVQANFRNNSAATLVRNGVVTTVHNEHLKSPANVVCHATKGLRFEQCEFTRLGGAGVDLEYGAQGNIITSCQFHDISGTAVQVGDVLKDDHHPDDPRKVVKDNAVVKNDIHDCCVEYMGGVGIFVGYTQATTIAHNKIHRLPYSGVSVGWGWGEEDAGGGSPSYVQPFRYETPTPAQDNRIESNHIFAVMNRLQDGGGIYTLGNMPGTIIRDNHVHDNAGVPGGIYLDEGSGFIELCGNVVYNVQNPMNYNNRAQDRIASCPEHDNFFGPAGERNLVPDQLGTPAQAIINKAGLHP
ncbi:MAG: right-handed parallel beta-helix repeat-containing protein [Pirellulaceae bacterium]